MNDGCCVECGDEFHLDDCGGYNPPCGCGVCSGAMCRKCCENERFRRDSYDDDDEDGGWMLNRDKADSLWDSTDEDDNADPR